MGGAIGEWSNSAPRAEPCHWATWVAPIFSEGNSLDSQEIKNKPDHQSLWWTFPLAPPSPPPAPPLGLLGASPCAPWPAWAAPGPPWPLSPSDPPWAPSPPAAPCPGPFWPPGPRWAPGPPWPPWAPLGPPRPPPGPPWAPLGPLGLSAEETSACPSLRPRQRWELRAPALNPKR